MSNMSNSPDAATRLLARLVRRMPPEHAEWGQAMLAEVVHIEGRLARWQFALGCIRVALFPPRELMLLQTAAQPGDRMSPQHVTASPTAAAVRGSLLLLPFVIANAIVANRIEPFFSLIRPGPHTSSREYALLAVVLLLIPLGAFVAALPLFARDATGARRFHPFNAVLAGCLLAVFFALAAGLGADIYRCDILGLTSCD
ncbi:MAG: hypothetical protein J0L64_10530 [Acidobacteria bacterium]|nr:hypothetical protein [Acidobacteriota bacterium]